MSPHCPLNSWEALEDERMILVLSLVVTMACLCVTVCQTKLRGNCVAVNSRTMPCLSSSKLEHINHPSFLDTVSFTLFQATLIKTLRLAVCYTGLDLLICFLEWPMHTYSGTLVKLNHSVKQCQIYWTITAMCQLSKTNAFGLLSFRRMTFSISCQLVPR